MRGWFRDEVRDATGRLLAGRSWRSNLVVDQAWTVLAGLLKRDRGMQGVLFWAVGTGLEAWDEAPASPSRSDRRLRNELSRFEVPDTAMEYVDVRGERSDGPTPELEVRMTLAWPDRAVTLREFGLFGGDATEGANSGLLINHVIHPRIDLEPGQGVTRRLRLAFRRGGGRRLVDLADHWLGEAPVSTLDGVGEHYEGVLTGLGFATVGTLAHSDPDRWGPDVHRVRLLELRAKARLGIQTVTELRPGGALGRVRVSVVLRGAPEGLARDAEVSVAEVVRLRDQLSTLELCMDHGFLERMTVAELAGTER